LVDKVATFTTADFDFTSPLVVDGTNNTMQLDVDNGADTAAITLTLSAGTYNNITELRDEINTQITASTENTNVTIAVNGQGLTLTSTDTTSAGGAAVSLTQGGTNPLDFPDTGTAVSSDIDSRTAATAGTFNTGNFTFPMADVSALNNTIDISVDGGEFFTLTLDSTQDPNGSGAGKLTNQADLVDFINIAITANTSLSPTGAGSETLVASAGAGTSVTFTSQSDGIASSVLVQSGTLTVPDATANLDGAAGGTFNYQEFDFVFDGAEVLSITAGDDIGINVNGGGLTDANLTATADYTDAATFAVALNAAIVTAGLDAEALVSDDGRKVRIQGTVTTETIALGAGTTDPQIDSQDGLVEHVNGDAVITSAAAFRAQTIATDDSLTFDIAGAGPVDVVFNLAAIQAQPGYSGAGVPSTNAELVDYLNTGFAISPAGSELQATLVGTDQIVITSQLGNSVVMGAGTSQTMGGAIDLYSEITGGNNVVAATSGVVQSGTLSIPTEVTDGINDKFSISVDGGLTYLEVDMDGADFDAGVDAVSMSAFADWMEDQVQAEGGALGAVTVTVNDAGDGLKFTDSATGTGSKMRLLDGFNDTGSVNDGGFAVTGTTQVHGVDGSSQETVTTTTYSVTAGVGTATPATLDDGDLVINGTAIGAADANDDKASDTTAATSNGAASGIATAAAINNATDSTGVTATVNATVVTGGDAPAGSPPTTGTGTIHINGVEAGAVVLGNDPEKNRAAAIDIINSVSGQTGVTAEDNGVSITMTAADGRNLSVAIDNGGTANFGSAIGLDSSEAGISEADFSSDALLNYASVAATTYSSVELSGSGEIEVTSGSAGSAALEELEFDQGSFGASERGTFISDIDISTLDGANAALTALDNALNSVSSERANLGAIQNRFETTISNLEITSENLTAANSRIKDADFATETAELARTQVLQQAGISILAQANALPQQALSLLQ